MAKLIKLLEDISIDEPKVNKREVVEGVKNYSIVGKQLYGNTNIMEVAKQLSKIAENAHTHILGETDDWFDKVSVNKNMKSLKTNVAEFKKAAVEANALNQRLTGLYEDIGHVLNRYYDISEDAGDMDNDGTNEPDDEEYLQNKRTAITKAVKDESLDPDNREDVDQPEHPARDGEEMKEAIRQTRENFEKRPTKRLKDIGNVATGIPSLGQIAKKFSK